MLHDEAFDKRCNTCFTLQTLLIFTLKDWSALGRIAHHCVYQ